MEATSMERLVVGHGRNTKPKAACAAGPGDGWRYSFAAEKRSKAFTTSARLTTAIVLR